MPKVIEWRDCEIKGEVVGMDCEPVYEEDGKTLRYSKYTVLVAPEPGKDKPDVRLLDK